MRWLVWRKIGAHFWELLSVERDETAKTIYFERCLAQISNAVFKQCVISTGTRLLEYGYESREM